MKSSFGIQMHALYVQMCYNRATLGRSDFNTSKQNLVDRTLVPQSQPVLTAYSQMPASEGLSLDMVKGPEEGRAAE